MYAHSSRMESECLQKKKCIPLSSLKKQKQVIKPGLFVNFHKDSSRTLKAPLSSNKFYFLKNYFSETKKRFEGLHEAAAKELHIMLM